MDQEVAASMCICAQCPTFIDCGEAIAFCLNAEGKSSCITVELGCVCPVCPVYLQQGMLHDFYCTQGPEHLFSEN